ncbi:hypothetical protein M422DRAFT_44355 [Sphaerobolus stellatus SS14]|nr:hypothetical protein M422DRAFT_44355 [Sphaerobolus stellatus SS14]
MSGRDRPRRGAAATSAAKSSPKKATGGRKTRNRSKQVVASPIVEPTIEQPVDGNPQQPTSISPFGPPPGIGGTSFVPDMTPSTSESAATNPMPEMPQSPSPIIEMQSDGKRKSPEVDAIQGLSTSIPKRPKTLPQTPGDLLAHFAQIQQPPTQLDATVPPSDRSISLSSTTISSTIPSPTLPQIDPLLQAHSTYPTSPCNADQPSQNLAPSNTVVQASEVESTGGTSVGERSPTFNGKRKLTSASPQTKSVLMKAALNYKVRLITDHPFPENKGWKSRFARDAWNRANTAKPPKGSAIKFTQAIEEVLHELGTTFRGSRGMELITLALAAYQLESPLSPKSRNMVRDLLIDGTFTYETVFFDANGNILRHSSDPNLLMCQKPAFSHPFIKTIVDRVIFKGRPAPAKHDPGKFNPIPLETIAYACTMGYFALKNVLAEDRIVFSGEDYSPIFDGFVEDPKVFEDLRSKLSQPTKAKIDDSNGHSAAGTMNGMTRSLSDADIAAELEKRQQIAPQITVQGSHNVAISTSIHSNSSISAPVSGIPLNHGYPHPPQYHVPYQFHGSPIVYQAPPGINSGPASSIVGPPVSGPIPHIAGPPVAGPPIAGPPVAGPPVAGPPVAGPPVAGPPVAGPSRTAPSQE